LAFADHADRLCAPLSYEFEMTPERARAAIGALEAILWHQNERLYQNLCTRMPWRQQLARVGLGLSAVGLGLSLFGVLFAPRLRLTFLATLVAFAVFLILFWKRDALAAAMRRGTRRLIARRARRLLAPAIRHAPYTIAYTLDDDRLAIQATGPTITGTSSLPAEIPLKRVRLAIIAPSMIGVFDRPLAQRPLRLLYVPGPTELQRLQDALTRNEAEVIAIA